MSDSLDVPLLLAEIEKRPPLWDFQLGQKNNRGTPKLWQEVAEIVGADVEQCKRKWRLLRDNYRGAVRLTNERIFKDKSFGVYDPNFNYAYRVDEMPLMRFLSKGGKYRSYSVRNLTGNNRSNELYNKNAENNIKPESSLGRDENDDEDDADDDIEFEEFQDIDAPESPKSFSDGLSNENSLEKSIAPASHTAEPLTRKESTAMQTAAKQTNRCTKLDHISDTDYNFLISFLPQMKKMSEVQNAKFRTEVCEMVLNISAENNEEFSEQPLAIDQPNDAIIPFTSDSKLE